MLVSIITVSYNSVNTISETIESVLSQNYQDIEYIVIDGSSNDGTIELIKSYGDKISKFVSEPDFGIYDAMNKGINIAKGDIIGMLNSDDYFTSRNIVKDIVYAFENNDIDAVYGDVKFVASKDKNKTVRYYSSKRFSPIKFRYGLMPPHPSFYVKRRFFDQLGLYKTNYKIAADYELLMRFILCYKLRCKYIEEAFVTMRIGGVSNKSILSNYILNKEILKACKENGIKTNLLNIYSKYFIKIFELVNVNK
jgi:glycosyltransferase involved in cell wall biosynthesis